MQEIVATVTRGPLTNAGQCRVWQSTAISECERTADGYRVRLVATSTAAAFDHLHDTVPGPIAAFDLAVPYAWMLHEAALAREAALHEVVFGPGTARPTRPTGGPSDHGYAA